MREKLLDLMKNEGLKPSQLAEMLEINPAGVSHILAGRNKPGFDLLQKILRRFPQINPDWLMLDSNKMYRDDAARSAAQFASLNGGGGNGVGVGNAFGTGGIGANSFASGTEHSPAPTLGAGGRGLTAAEVRAMGGNPTSAEGSMASNANNGGLNVGRTAAGNVGQFGAGGEMANNLAGGNTSAMGYSQYVGAGGGNNGSMGGYNAANGGGNMGNFGVTGGSGALQGGVAVAKVIVFYSDNTFEWYVPR